MAILGPGPAFDDDRIYSEISLDVEDPNRPSQMVYIRDAIVSGHGYLISNRRLALQIYTTTETKDGTEQLAAVAGSVTFSPDGPANQKALYFPDDPPVNTLLEEYLQRVDEGTAVVEAVNYRLQTGEVANRLLDGMSEGAREQYERVLADSTEHIAEVDRRRAMPVSPLVLPTSNPDTFGEEFHEQERIYNEGLKNSDPKASDSPLPLPTTTP